MTDLVTIVIPVYKTEKYLSACVDSALMQTYKNIEIVLVDDGSPDNAPKLCDDLADNYDSISVIHKENGGLSSARNEGIKAAKGKYIMFLDSDDRLPQDLVEDMLRIISEEKSDAVIPDSYYKVYENKDDQILSYHFTEEMFSDDPKIFALEILIRKGRSRRSTSVLYNLDLIKNNDILYPLGRISEDFFFSLDFFSAAEKISLYKKPSLFNLKREGSISSSYYENFFDTVLEMDKEVQKFIARIDKDKYGKYIEGSRETLLYRNLLIYVINVMGAKQHSYKERKTRCIAMLKNETFQEALHSDVGTPYFEGNFQKIYMGISLKLIKMRMYSLTCFLAYIAARINTV